MLEVGEIIGEETERAHDKGCSLFLVYYLLVGWRERPSAGLNCNSKFSLFTE